MSYNNRSNEDIWADRLERNGTRAANSFTRHPILWIVGFFALIAIISVVSGIINFGADYAREGKRVVSVQNVKEQTTKVLDDWTAMQQAAANACQVQDSARSADDPVLVEDPALAYKATYRQIAQDYDRRMSNFFEAAEAKRIPLPDGIHGLPREAPSVKEAIAQAQADGDC